MCDFAADGKAAEELMLGRWRSRERAGWTPRIIFIRCSRTIRPSSCGWMS